MEKDLHQFLTPPAKSPKFLRGKSLPWILARIPPRFFFSWIPNSLFLKTNLISYCKKFSPGYGRRSDPISLGWKSSLRKIASYFDISPIIYLVTMNSQRTLTAQQFRQIPIQYSGVNSSPSLYPNGYRFRISSIRQLLHRWIKPSFTYTCIPTARTHAPTTFQLRFESLNNFGYLPAATWWDLSLDPVLRIYSRVFPVRLFPFPSRFFTS